jgi:pilus assembly protein CpaE
VLALLGGVFWYLRQSAAEEQAPADKAVKPKKIKPATQDEAGSAGQAPPATAPASPASSSAAPPVAGVTSPPKLKDNQIGEKIRILIVDDNPDTRGHVSRLLYFEDDMEVIGQAVNGQDGIDQAIELKPHIVLMDINMPDMDGITATREMSMQAPFSQVVMMSVQAEQHYMKQAMAAGARDFQPKPFTADELIGCVRRVYDIGRPIYDKLEAIEQVQAQVAAQAPSKTGQGAADAPVIAVYSPKGGIGTSVLAANLAVALQREYGDVVLVDADLQFGDILVHLNTRATRTMSDLIHQGELDIELLPDVLLSHNSGLKLLLSPPQPEYADAITPDIIDKIIKGLKSDFKIVLVDTCSKLNEPTMTVLENADYILMLTSPELPAVKSAKLFLELADRLEFDSERLGVIINRANLSGGISPKQIGKVLKLKHAYFVPHDPRLHMAINKGIAVTQEDAGAPSAQAITDLAQEVWQKLVEREMQPLREAA